MIIIKHSLPIHCHNVADKPGDADKAEANEADKAKADEADAEVDEAVEAILDNAANEAIVANEAADSDNEADVAETANNPTIRQS